MYKWYVLQVMSGHEKKVQRTLLESVEKNQLQEVVKQILVPTENVAEVKKGAQKVTEKRLWPGYVLIQMIINDDIWSLFKNTNGVIDFLGGEKPLALTDKEVEEILQELEERKKGVVQKHKIDVGDKVKITDGVFVNFVGTVLEVNHEKGRLSVMVTIFGRDTRVDDLEFWQVEEVTSETE